MPPPEKRSGPHRHSAARRRIQSPPNDSALSISRPGARRSANPARELAAWAAAVEHLHAAGLPAAVPEFAAAWLRRRGVRADWKAAA
jgi:hypothetical protein